MPPDFTQSVGGLLRTVFGCVGSQGRQTTASEATSHQYGTHTKDSDGSAVPPSPQHVVTAPYWPPGIAGFGPKWPCQG